MAITYADMELAWQRAQATCECTDAHHKHPGSRCAQPLVWANRGRHGEGRWEAQSHGAPGKPHTDVRIVCWDCQAKDFR